MWKFKSKIDFIEIDDILLPSSLARKGVFIFKPKAQKRLHNSSFNLRFSLNLQHG
jgi:hypothetical protein